MLLFEIQYGFVSAESMNGTKINSSSANNGTHFLSNNHTMYDAPPVFSPEATDDTTPLEGTLPPESPLISAEFEDEDELTYFQNGQPSNSSTSNNNSSATCAVTLNARNDLCAQHLHQLTEDHDGDIVPCDCYNFCNGRLLGCLAFGERVTFACTGSLVAGCAIEQLQYFVPDDNGVATSNAYRGDKSGMRNVFTMGVLVTGLCLGSSGLGGW